MNTSFERTEKKEEWLTPPHVLKACGPFDLDPCAPVDRPWSMASEHFTILDNGLVKPWPSESFVWCNPPYGGETGKWFRRMVEHRNGIALTFARTETRMFFEHVWGAADAIFFIKGRLSFCDTSGKPGGVAGAPSVLIAYGQLARVRLFGCPLDGKFLDLRRGSEVEKQKNLF